MFVFSPTFPCWYRLNETFWCHLIQWRYQSHFKGKIFSPASSSLHILKTMKLLAYEMYCLQEKQIWQLFQLPPLWNCLPLTPHLTDSTLYMVIRFLTIHSSTPSFPETCRSQSKESCHRFSLDQKSNTTFFSLNISAVILQRRGHQWYFSVAQNCLSSNIILFLNFTISG